MGAGAASGVLVSEADALLEVAVDAARMAGALLAERVRHGSEQHVASKSTPTDLVSEADTSSERAIRELLAERRPDDGFVGEEGGSAQGTSGLRWVVDPLDGTINFLFGIPQWSVSVAVRDERGTVAGAVYDPNRNELFTATRGGRPRMFGPSGVLELSGPRHGQGDGEVAGTDADGEHGDGDGGHGALLRRERARRAGAGARAR